MKKLIGIALVLALVTTLCFGTVALAAPPTEVKISWGGGTFEAGDYPVVTGLGRIAATVTAGDDAIIKFDTWGDDILGSFTAKDFNNASQPDGYYCVDTVSSKLDAHVDNGYIEFSHKRTASLSIYGPAGQTSYNYLQVIDGWGELRKSGSISNMATLQDVHYGVGPQQYQPGQFKVDADQYLIERKMTSNTALAYVWALGSGTAELGAGDSRATGWGGDIAFLSRTPAYWNDCAFSGVHVDGAFTSSVFSLLGAGPNGGVTFDEYWGGLNDLGSQTGVTLTQSGSFSSQVQSGNANTFVGPAASLQIIASFTGGLEVADFSTTAN